jgi:hypothetical protein
MASDGGGDMKDVVVLVLASMVGILGLAKATYEFRQTRIRPLAREQTSQTRVLRLETEPEKYDTPAAWRAWKFFAWVEALFGILLLVGAWYGYEKVLVGEPFLDFAPTSLALKVGLLTVFLVGMAWVFTFGWYISLLQPTKAGDPIHSASVTLLVRADLPTILGQCQQALCEMNALRSKGTQLVFDSDQYARLEGGTGIWPEKTRGHKLSITINKHDQECYTLEITSASYWPGLFLKKKDAANITRIVQQFF